MESRQVSAHLLELLELGIQHEQQHQELLITDMKYIWGLSPLYPVYQPSAIASKETSAAFQWLSVEEGIYETGESGAEFHYDNESPNHKVWLDGFEIGSRPVTVGEYVEFIEAGGYNQWQHWLHEGWQWLATLDVKAPMYWKKLNGKWHIYTLSGLHVIDENETLTHVSFYEANAFARWKRLRLPTEEEWEIAAKKYGNNDINHNFLDNRIFHPTAVTGDDKAFLGQVWEWTNSAYLPYPRFRPWEGDIGEYNGKFMVNQMVLRGGSCLTPMDHIRFSYRNFFHPHLRWQFTGIRLAKNA